MQNLDYFTNIVKPCLRDLQRCKEKSTTEIERGFYEDRIAAQANDFALAMDVTILELWELMEK